MLSRASPNQECGVNGPVCVDEYICINGPH